jgi:bacillolysin
MNKRTLALFMGVIFALSIALAAADVGPRWLVLPGGEPERATQAALPMKSQIALMNEHLAQGHLVMLRQQDDPLAGMIHRRYSQVHQGLPVFGGEVVFHDQAGVTIMVSGKFFKIGTMNINPVLDALAATDAFHPFIDPEKAAQPFGNPKLVIYPVSDEDMRLAYLVTFAAGREYNVTGVIDAVNGAILNQFSNVWFDNGAIGLGQGYHGEQVKLATTFADNTYYLADEKRIRPVNQYTYDNKLGGNIPTSAGNTFSSTPEAVNAHQFCGYTYDFYYTVLGRLGIDGQNLPVLTLVNYDSVEDNAFWTSQNNMMVFGVPGSQGQQYAAAIDVVGHELSHGVTQFSANLVYSYDSGALNESYSDVMGTAVEFTFQPEGTGLMKADWCIGEDGHNVYSTAGCRNLADPNTNSQLKDAGYPDGYWYPDPCHLSQKIPELYYQGRLVDYGGVHLNMTIFGHAYYLLTHGGTNKISGRTVTGIGMEKATKIYYRAFTAYLTNTAQFDNAANALLASASSLYGQSSNEYNQTYASMLAIGFQAN